MGSATLTITNFAYEGGENVAAEDNCDDDVQIDYDGEEIIPGDCDGSYTIIRTWTAIDNCLNETSMSQTITVIDTTAPEFTFVPEGGSYSCDEDLPEVNAEAEDNCSDAEVTWSDETIDGDCPQSYTVVRTFVATDDCGNSASTSIEFNVYDEEAPVFTFVPANAVYECDEEIIYEDAIAEDNCGVAVVTEIPAIEPGLCDNEYILTRVFIAIDECGNQSSAAQVITVVDTTAPVFDAYEVNIEMPCDDINDAILVSATDNCGDVTITYEDDQVSGGCAGVIIRDYTAVDACGNEAYAQQIINLTDEVAPELAGVPADETIECGDNIPAPAEVTASDNCDDELEVMFSEEIVDNDCLYSIVRTWTVMDHCGNEDTASQTITIVDTTAPEFEGQDYTVESECDEPVLLDQPQAFDICDEAVEITSNTEVIDGDCPNSWTEVTTFTATDDCGNSSQLVATVIYSDNTAPEFTFVPANAVYECDEDIVFEDAIASDNCGDVVVTEIPVTEPGFCPNTYILTRVFIAIDECGNESAASQVITVIDTTAPEFDQEVEDVTVECYGDVVIPELTATDNCGVATVTSEVIENVDDCGNGEILVIYTATDECFNINQTDFTITINDTTAPEFNEELPADMVIDCEAEVPAAPELTATDNCEGLIDVDYSEELIGDLPAEGSIADCALSTGDSPYYNPDWSLWLQLFPNGDEFYYTTGANFVEYPDGTAHLTGHVTSTTGADAGWDIDVWFMNGMDWTEWSTQDFPTSFKDDFNIAGDNYLDWTYYIINASSATLTGTGDYAGSLIELSHAPSNFFYGYQVGVAANNVNGNYGNGGWFYYDGTLVVNGIETLVSGAGDFAFDADCCPQYEIVRTWTATDCSGNSVSWSQNISFGDVDGDNTPISPEDLEANQYGGHQSKGGSFTPALIYKAYPNPVLVNGTIELTTAEAGQTTIEVFSMSGQKVATLFNQSVDAQSTHKVEFNTGDLSEGVYIYQITNGDTIVTDRLIINK